MDSAYENKVNWLFNQFPAFQKVGESAYKPTLENTKKLIEHLNVPIEKMKFVHVAGTNGKGTTCSIIASALTESRLKVGMFTSPHIKDFRERIRINGEMISQEEVLAYITTFQSSSFEISPSFFEMTWAMALAYFYQEKCDIVVVETGLGGRLDATNVIEPELSVITNIELDHVAILGDTRTKIATEKAGIIKQNVPVIIGESDEEIEGVFVRAAQERNAPLYFLPENDKVSTYEKNQLLAFFAIDILLHNQPDLASIKQRAMDRLFINTGLYGRNQIYSTNPLIIIDAAHNVMGIQRFLDYIALTYPNKKIRALYGASNDKDVKAIVKLFPKKWEYYFTEFGGNRSTEISVFKAIAEENKIKSKYFSDSKKAFIEIQESVNEEVVIVVFGSFFLLEKII
ncbi:MAG TPA: Mur ligase family protein [Brumimicrobium sp.]|nr:Mur ligase family protein [Brumimicrobium sp.]